MKNLSFSGHESFTCKQFWLKKGYDFIKEGKKFSEEDSVIDLGVGKNMVTSIKFWLKAFGLIDEKDTPTRIADYLLGKKSKDPYLEDFGTIWLLHYHLITTNRASIYNLVFNEFRVERVDFTKEHLQSFVKRKCEESESAFSPNTVEADVRVFLRNYVKPNQQDEKVDVEDDFSGLLMDLELVKRYKVRNNEGKLIEWYKIESEFRVDLPYQIVLYSILKNYEGKESISFRELLTGINSPGSVFALNSDSLFEKIEQISKHYPRVVYSETAGNRILQLKLKEKPLDILDDYYGN